MEPTIKVKALTDPQVVFETSSRTQGFSETKESLKLFKQLLVAEHSPIRNYLIQIDMLSIPYYVQVHLVRHKFGVEHFVRTQRPDSYNPIIFKYFNVRSKILRSKIFVLSCISKYFNFFHFLNTSFGSDFFMET